MACRYYANEECTCMSKQYTRTSKECTHMLTHISVLCIRTCKIVSKERRYQMKLQWSGWFEGHGLEILCKREVHYWAAHGDHSGGRSCRKVQSKTLPWHVGRFAGLCPSWKEAIKDPEVNEREGEWKEKEEISKGISVGKYLCIERWYIISPLFL